MEYQGVGSACGGQASDRGDVCVCWCVSVHREIQKEGSLIGCELSKFSRATPFLPSSAALSFSVFPPVLLWETEELLRIFSTAV